MSRKRRCNQERPSNFRNHGQAREALVTSKPFWQILEETVVQDLRREFAMSSENQSQKRSNEVAIHQPHRSVSNNQTFNHTKKRDILHMALDELKETSQRIIFAPLPEISPVKSSLKSYQQPKYLREPVSQGANVSNILNRNPTTNLSPETIAVRNEENNSAQTSQGQKVAAVYPMSSEEFLAFKILNQHGADLKVPFTKIDLKRAWHRAAFMSHPDRKSGSRNETETAEFAEVKKAQEILLRYLKKKTI
jgi:hypothetical protein